MYLGNKLPFRIDSSWVGFIFFSIGYYGKNIFRQFQSLSRWQLYSLMIISLFALVILSHLLLDFNQGQNLSINAVSIGKQPILFLLSGVVGTIFIFSLSQLLDKLYCKAIQVISSGTIIILGFHHVVFMLFKHIVTTFNPIFAIAFSFCVFSFCALLIPVVDRHFPALLGNRKISQ